MEHNSFSEGQVFPLLRSFQTMYSGQKGARTHRCAHTQFGNKFFADLTCLFSVRYELKKILGVCNLRGLYTFM
jgi:hypothetical protein